MKVLTNISFVFWLTLIFIVLPVYGKTNASDASEQAPLAASLKETALIIDDIICIGNDHTHCSFIRNKYYQQIGDELNPDDIIDAKLRLGTLIQFKHIDVYLRKGKQRGHVVVVFDIEEASNLQYELSYDVKRIKSKEDFYACFGETVPDNKEALINLCDKDKYRISETQQYISSRATDFNFLGSGKELSLGVSGYKYDKDADHFKQSLIEPADTDSWFTRYIIKHNTLSLDYYDPHLFNSPYYYFNATIELTKSRSKYTEIDDNNSEISHENNPLNKRSWFSFGKRFARYSYVSLDIAGDLDEKIDENYSFNYGFNSENDTLFPVYGEKLSTRYTTLSNGHRYQLSYISHVNIDDYSAISLGVNTDYYKESNRQFYSKIEDVGISARYSNYKVIDAKVGAFSGWSLGATFRRTKDWYGSNPQEDFRIIEFDAGYTYQTENMIYRFFLKVGLNESQ
ncbi:hypothetical protein [Pseudoalteromonas aurantia]|uniref:Uncharacterized protein n=1 Tax=Pseudoalteromonas aurantia TaxID=43654 RepID=A0ABY2VZL9_9GAMM|nr:hypothetical protein [Pseudoalteromonas aurantia]TMO67132.1 hypothetical protein CWC18_01635 [Pseudoalteromonas aurantia]TMO75904.1 hypothetical protein CWC20_06505 [Pseudoalteromonas aurantia]